MVVVFVAMSGSGHSMLAAGQKRSRPQATAPTSVFEVSEQSISALQAAQADGRVTSRGLVEAYLARIVAYDQAGPRLNAIVTLNPHALDDADALDRERARSGPRGPLHGIPVLVKDNYDTADMPTSGGALALATMQPSTDAFQVKRLREAGAVILGKTAMHELAAGITTISSLTGQTRNPYDLMRVPGGSSGGTGAAVAASFAAAGMGSDTCGSIRVPAANQNLVGLRPTRGLSSRTGVMPLSDLQDVAGPLARTVTDLAAMLDATVGPDPEDAVTAGAAAHVPSSYRSGLDAAHFKGTRVGVLRGLTSTAPEDEEVAGVVQKALDAMKAKGAEVVDVSVPGLDDLLRDSSVIADEFKFDLAAYLSRHPNAPVKSLGEIIDRGLNHAALDAVFRLRNAPDKRESEHYRQALLKRRALRDALETALEAQRLDVMAYPTLRRKPVNIGEPQLGSNCQLSASTGLPAISMPAGFTEDVLPVGIEFLGPAFSEQRLLGLAFAWEQEAALRRAPFSAPPLVNGAAPRPLVVAVTVGAPPAANGSAQFTYDMTRGVLQYEATVKGLVEGDRVIALTLQRGADDHPGPVVAHLLAGGRNAAAGSLTLRGRDREEFVSGDLFMHLYTQRAPLGVGRARVILR